MREILFRGKRIDNGEWVEGYFVKFERREIPEIYTGWNCYTLTPECYGIEPSTVGQYTGLTDKDDRKIFEGDIVNILAIDKNRVVRFDEGGFCLDAGSLRDYRCFGKMAIKVIGNIHDNPELLEVDK